MKKEPVVSIPNSHKNFSQIFGFKVFDHHMTSSLQLVHLGVRHWDPTFLYQVHLNEIARYYE